MPIVFPTNLSGCMIGIFGHGALCPGYYCQDMIECTCGAHAGQEGGWLAGSLRLGP